MILHWFLFCTMDFPRFSYDFALIFMDSHGSALALAAEPVPNPNPIRLSPKTWRCGSAVALEFVLRHPDCMYIYIYKCTIFYNFLRIFLDFERISVIPRLEGRAACRGLWQPVASCGWELRPLCHSASVLGAGCLSGGVEGWMAGWLDGWLGGWMGGPL